METPLSPTKIEFLLKLKDLLNEYNTFFSYMYPDKIQIWILKNELDDNNIVPIDFPNQFDYDEIGELLENNSENMKMLELVGK